MTDRYKTRFASLRKQNRKAFIPFTMLGYPDRQACLATIKTMIESGVTALELGIAFSDPIADGPVIQEAAHQVIESGFHVKDAFALIEEVRTIDKEIPIGLLVYYNMVLASGVDNFYQKAASAGVDGILIVDLPPEEASESVKAGKRHGIAQILIVSPATNRERMDLILSAAGGFIYVVSRLGITGTEVTYDAQLATLIQDIKSKTELPACVGFGISTPKQAAKILALGADGVITGSRIIQIISSTAVAERQEALSDYLHSMQGSTKLTV